MTEGEIPRRLRRFYRQKPTEDELRQKSTEMAIKEVDTFRQKHARYPQTNELDEISDNIFSQLKKELENAGDVAEEISSQLGEKPGKKATAQGKTLLEERKLRREKESKETGKTTEGNRKNEKNTATKEKEATTEENPEEEDLGELEEENGEKMPDLSQEDEENVRKLAEMDELAKLSGGLDSQDDSDMIEKELEADDTKCPNCGNKAKELIYCPNCGEAFCDHCAKNVEVQEQLVKYTCPKCGKDFRKNRGRQ